jgi:hypothetical protein
MKITLEIETDEQYTSMDAVNGLVNVVTADAEELLDVRLKLGEIASVEDSLTYNQGAQKAQKAQYAQYTIMVVK